MMQTSNLLMAALMATSENRPLPPAKQVAIPSGVPLSDTHIYGQQIFVVENGVVGTLVKSRKSGRISEVGMIGFEGLFPVGPLVGVAPPSDYMVVPQLGTLKANLFELDDFQSWIQGNAEARALLNHYLYFQLIEKNSTIACMDQQGVEERVCRTLLMCHDRSFGDILRITHEEIAQMISSYRPTITNCVHSLEDQKAIKLYRGQIEILDRNRLQEICDGTYGYAEKFYRDNIGPFGKN